MNLRTEENNYLSQNENKYFLKKGREHQKIKQNKILI